MAYTKTSWVARVGTALNRFLKTNETSTEVELTNDPTGVTTAGTPFTVDNMNKIEDGIYSSHYPTFTEASTLENIASGEVQETLWGKVKKAISAVITHDGYLNQGVKTTDSPTFANMNPPVDNNDNSLPSIGIGGFTYGTVEGNGSITLPTGGTYITIGFTTDGVPVVELIGRFSGGTTLKHSLVFPAIIMVWRIA